MSSYKPPENEQFWGLVFFFVGELPPNYRCTNLAHFRTFWRSLVMFGLVTSEEEESEYNIIALESVHYRYLFSYMYVYTR